MATEFDPIAVHEVHENLDRVVRDTLSDHRIVGTHYIFTPGDGERLDHAEVVAEIVATQGLDFSDPNVLAGLVKFAMRRGERYGTEDYEATAAAWR